MLKSISRLASGSALAQILSFLTLPLVMRLYSPTEYGVYGTALVFVGVGAIVATMQVQQAIVLPKLEVHALGLFWIGVLASILGSALISLSVLIYFLFFSRFEAGLDSMYSLLIGLAVLATGLSQCIQSLVLRYNAFGTVAAVSIARTLIVVSFQAGLGYFGWGWNGLVAAYILGELVSFFIFWFSAVPKSSRLMPWRTKLRYVVLLRKNKEFCFFGTLQEALNSASQGIPVLLLGWFYGPAVAGYYALSMKVLLAPGQLVANAVRQVSSVKFASLLNESKSLRPDFRRLTVFLALPSIVVSILLFPFFPRLYELLFGVEWRVSGEYARWLVFWAAFMVFNTPSAVVFRVLKKQKESFLINTVIFLTRFLVLILGGVFFDAVGAVGAFSVLGVLWIVFFIHRDNIFINNLEWL